MKQQNIQEIHNEGKGKKNGYQMELIVWYSLNGVPCSFVNNF